MSTTTWTHPLDYVRRRRWTPVDGPTAATKSVSDAQAILAYSPFLRRRDLRPDLTSASGCGGSYEGGAAAAAFRLPVAPGGRHRASNSRVAPRWHAVSAPGSSWRL